MWAQLSRVSALVREMADPDTVRCVGFVGSAVPCVSTGLR